MPITQSDFMRDPTLCNEVIFNDLITAAIKGSQCGSAVLNNYQGCDRETFAKAIINEDINFFVLSDHVSPKKQDAVFYAIVCMQAFELNDDDDDPRQTIMLYTPEEHRSKVFKMLKEEIREQDRNR